MSKPNIPDPVAAAQRVKGIARDLAADVSETYRKSNRYLRLRATIVGSWVLLALVALYTACPSSGPTNDLAAEVTLLPETLVGQQISISNGSRDMWKDVTLTLDGKWQHRIPTVRAGQNVVVGVAKFARDGASAPPDLKPRRIEIDCDRGSVDLSLQRR
jgi:hypothetical protein